MIQFDGILKQQKSMWTKIKFNYFSYKRTYICSDPTPEAIVKKALNAFLERS